MANENLGNARTAKNDEFYTQFDDIQKEMNAYLDFNPDVFRGKTVLLPCDDPEWSNFTRYFAQNFQTLGLKKLISTSYAPNSKPLAIPYQPTLFEMDSPEFDEQKTQANGKIFTLTQDVTDDDVINLDDLEWSYLESDGDFRSDEVTALRDEADIIITNPPFSLFREFLGWLVEANKEFVILGNMNAITYKEVFRLIQADRLWLGVTRTGVGFMWFEVTESAPEKSGQRVEDGKRFQTIGNSAWFTNLDHGRRHEPLVLMTEKENVKFSRHKELKDCGYRRYDNYDAIEVPFVDAIPSDFEGVMGVPITFLGKYNPEQFEILGKTERDDHLRNKIYSKHDFANAGDLNRGPTVLTDGKPINLYQRIMIRHRKASS